MAKLKNKTTKKVAKKAVAKKTKKTVKKVTKKTVGKVPKSVASSVKRAPKKATARKVKPKKVVRKTATSRISPKKTIKRSVPKVKTVTELGKSEIVYEEEDKNVEYVYDQITGGRMKKPVMSVLNKTKLSKYEMDDLFNSWD